MASKYRPPPMSKLVRAGLIVLSDVKSTYHGWLADFCELALVQALRSDLETYDEHNLDIAPLLTQLIERENWLIRKIYFFERE